MVVGVDGDPPLRMELVSNLADVKAGDVVVASGVDGIYPKGFTIGTVEKSSAATASIARSRSGRRWISRRSRRCSSCSLPARAATGGRPPRRAGRQMKAVGVLLALAGALALQTTLAGLTIGGGDGWSTSSSSR